MESARANHKKFVTDEWDNFLERVDCSNEEDLMGNVKLEEELRLWASYRGQTLTKTGKEFILCLCHHLKSMHKGLTA